MSSSAHEPGEDEAPPPHTEEHMTADSQTGDRDPEVEEQQPPRRRNLEEAADRVPDDEDEGVERE